MIGFVLAGGYGKRLLPITQGTPKPFLQLMGRQLLDYSIETLREAKVDDVVVVVTKGFANLASVGREGVRVVEQRGDDIQGALRTAHDEASAAKERDAVIVYTGFLASPPTIAKLAVDYYQSSGFPIVLALASAATGLETYGFVTVDYRGVVKEFMWESPEAKRWGVGRGYVFGGVMVADVGKLEEASRTSFGESMRSLAGQGVVGGIQWPGRWVEIGYPWDLLEAIDMLLEGSGSVISSKASVSRSAIVGDNVIIDDGAVVEDGAIVKGPAYIGRGVRVRSGAVVENFSAVERDSVIGENAVVERSYIGARVQVGSLSEVRGSVVGEGAAIGPGAHLVEDSPERLPERLRWLADYLGQGVRLGAVVAPGLKVPCCTMSGGGSVLS
ncbi:MAG: NDP-sugar synthase [Acidilobus sp.]|jgi:NDP-sugar pyrophosphorylase family protein